VEAMHSNKNEQIIGMQLPFSQKLKILLTAILMLLVSKPAISGIPVDNHSPIGDSNQTNCEIRVFTRRNFEILDTTKFPGGGVIGAGLSAAYGSGDTGKQAEIAKNALGSDRQHEIIVAFFSSSAPFFQNKKVVFDELKLKFLDIYNDRKKLPRLSLSNSTCYSEIIVNLRYVRTSLYGKVATTIIFRDFGTKNSPTKVTWFEKTNNAKYMLDSSGFSYQQREDIFVFMLNESLAGLARKLDKQ
jgi:hypothetical protein